jgi:hypothetical protein
MILVPAKHLHFHLNLSHFVPIFVNGQFLLSTTGHSDKSQFCKNHFSFWSVVTCKLTITGAVLFDLIKVSAACVTVLSDWSSVQQARQQYNRNQKMSLYTRNSIYWRMLTSVCELVFYCIKIDQLDVTCFIISLFTAQHVSNVSTSIFRSLLLSCWVISCVVLLSYAVCWCYGVVRLGWCGILMQAEALHPSRTTP